MADQIRLDHSTWLVKAYPWVPKQVAKDKPAVAVWRSTLEPGDNKLEIRHDLVVNLYTSRTAEEAAEQEAEDLLDELLLSLQRLGLVAWSKAERMIFDNVITGWQITCHLGSTDIYRQAVLAERG